MKKTEDVFCIEQCSEHILLKITGGIDGHIDFPRFLIPEGRWLVIDLDGFKGISSIGIQRWIQWLDSLRPKHLTLERCPKPFVDQMNNVKNFVPKSCLVKSFYVPYYSYFTEEEAMILFVRGVHYKDKEEAISYPWVLDTSNNAMEPDIHPEKYFRFLKDSRSIRQDDL